MPAEKLGVSPYSAAARRTHTCAWPADRNNRSILVDYGQRALAISSLGLSGHYCHEPVKVKLGGASARGVRPATITRHPVFDLVCVNRRGQPPAYGRIFRLISKVQAEFL